ncbi:MAG: hemolysin family protein [Chloroflexi bacterium]|nr:hemolysin family protein [Chloroflexota bacterium]MQC16725.1 HlyC/CorC family transporter [Chloroflexota bacterium]
MTQLIIIGALIALNALYVAGEFAAVSTRRTRVRQMAESGNRPAIWMLNVLDTPGGLDRYVAACQIGITLSSLLLGAYGQAAITPWLSGIFSDVFGSSDAASVGTAATVVLVTLTSTQVVLGELLPKSVALQFPTPVALYTSIPMRWSLWAFRPLIAILNGSGLAVLRLLRTPSSGHHHVHSPGEIALLIADSRKGGLLSSEEQDRFERALRLSVTPVRRIMVPRIDIVSVDEDSTLHEVRARFSATEFTRIPVYRRSPDQIIGVVHAREVAREIARGSTNRQLREIMRPIASVPESMRCERLVAELRRQRSEQAIVVDEHGGIAGLVTLEDLLAEVLGETPLHSSEQGEPEHLPDGRVRLPGRMRIDTAAEWLGSRWDGESDTLSGIIVEHMGRIPNPGDCIEIGGVEVEIEAADALVVSSVLARPASQQVMVGFTDDD